MDLGSIGSRKELSFLVLFSILFVIYVYQL